MEYSTRPNRSDAHLDAKAAAEIEAATKHYFEEAAPKRHNKPQRSEYSSTYVDDLSAGDDQPIPENLQFQNLEKDTQKVVPDGSEVVEEFIETEYYTDLNCVDKQHHTTGTGFIKVDDANEKSFSIVPDGATESHVSSRGNPATNDWIPATANTVDFVTGKPNRSE